MNQHSDFLTFSRKDDRFLAEANGFHIAYLRLEFGRIRAGMADFLVKVAAPRAETVNVNNKTPNSVLTLRCKKNHASQAGALATAKTIIAQMKKRGDKSTDWDAVNAEHLAAMIAPTLKFFALNTNTMNMEAVTEALS